jgi:hypothetical protein
MEPRATVALNEETMANVEYDKDVYAGVAAKFETLLARAPNERAVQNFLKRYPYIVRNALNVHAWNSVHLRPEFRLGGDHIADFLILSADSGAWHAVLIELESPTARPFTKNWNPSRALAKGLAQLDEWNIWIKHNDPLFREQLSSLVEPKRPPNQGSNASDQQLEHTTIRDPRTVIDKEYIVVVGRRTFFTDSDTQERRGEYRHRGQQIRSYDRLLDTAKNLDPSLEDASP